MIRLVALTTLACLTLAACGGGGGNSANQATLPAKQSRLVAFDDNGLAEGLQIPDFTQYWTLSEQRNGNVFPIKAGVDDETVKTIRLDSNGAFGEYRGGEFVSQSLTGISSGMETLAKRHWNEEQKATMASLILFADQRAGFSLLLKLCREMVDLQVRNLWLVTHDERGDALRLLPLKVDVAQVFNQWYSLPAKEARPTLRISQTGSSARLAWADAPDRPFTFEGDDWRKELESKLSTFSARATRIQFDLALEAKLSDFADNANLLAPIGYADVEPFWPALDRKPDEPEVVVPKRELLSFDDSLDVTEGITPPNVSDFWRASAANRGLPGAMVTDPKLPLLAIRASASGVYSTRTRDVAEWTQHNDDQEVVEAMQRNAGEVDFDTGTSDLQIVLCIDREARWETFLAVLEMMRSSMCYRLAVVTTDVLGPTLRLLDLSLPLGDPPQEAQLAAINVQRNGPPADADYRIEMLLDGKTRNTSGGAFGSTLARWATEREKDVDLLAVKLPRDEPFQTFFNVLNSLAWLGMGSFRIGG
ncbi:MAG: hypothetical protein KDB29_07550 [Planctomycetes bacterium]|nr:hypothetical protein [Planctomycetota bacterium]